jgi:hypothetical protein
VRPTSLTLLTRPLSSNPKSKIQNEKAAVVNQSRNLKSKIQNLKWSGGDSHLFDLFVVIHEQILLPRGPRLGVVA